MCGADRAAACSRFSGYLSTDVIRSVDQCVPGAQRRRPGCASRVCACRHACAEQGRVALLSFGDAWPGYREALAYPIGVVHLKYEVIEIVKGDPGQLTDLHFRLYGNPDDGVFRPGNAYLCLIREEGNAFPLASVPMRRTRFRKAAKYRDGPPFESTIAVYGSRDTEELGIQLDLRR